MAVFACASNITLYTEKYEGSASILGLASAYYATTTATNMAAVAFGSTITLYCKVLGHGASALGSVTYQGSSTLWQEEPR